MHSHISYLSQRLLVFRLCCYFFLVYLISSQQYITKTIPVSGVYRIEVYIEKNKNKNLKIGELNMLSSHDKEKKGYPKYMGNMIIMLK